MSQKTSLPFGVPAGFPGLTESTRNSFAAVSRAYSEWLHGANRLQAEMIRFGADRFNKDVALISRFGQCHDPEDFVKLQADAMAELANDYLEQGARIVKLFGDATKAATGEFAGNGGRARKS
jgi:hypothetical protein